MHNNGDGYFVRLRRDLKTDGNAGASAHQESLRRRQGRSWAVGADGERQVGRALDALTPRGVVVLHDRRIPGSRANIDHIVIGPAGVFVIDAKKYRGRVEPRSGRLFVNGRDRSRLVESMTKQVWEVEAALARPAVPVRPVLCFVDAEWPLLRKPLRLGTVVVAWPGKLEQIVWRDGPLGAGTVQDLGGILKQALPPA